MSNTDLDPDEKRKIILFLIISEINTGNVQRVNVHNTWDRIVAVRLEI